MYQGRKKKGDEGIKGSPLEFYEGTLVSDHEAAINAASARDKKLVNRALHCRGIKVTWYDDMYAYYLCHIAEIMPYAYLCYRIDCDLTSHSVHVVH